MAKKLLDRLRDKYKLLWCTYVINKLNKDEIKSPLNFLGIPLIKNWLKFR